jgi:serine/threonine protein phosphatase PrpC
VTSAQLDVSRDEFVVLACDGLWDVMSSEEAVAFVRERLKR